MNAELPKIWITFPAESTSKPSGLQTTHRPSTTNHKEFGTIKSQTFFLDFLGATQHYTSHENSTMLCMCNSIKKILYKNHLMDSTEVWIHAPLQAHKCDTPGYMTFECSCQTNRKKSVQQCKARSQTGARRMDRGYRPAGWTDAYLTLENLAALELD